MIICAITTPCAKSLAVKVYQSELLAEGELE